VARWGSDVEPELEEIERLDGEVRSTLEGELA
jgi:hypothetical protein